jgi:integrase/recombinase XerC
VDAFLRHLKVERQLSPLTQLSYEHQLQALMLLAQSIGVSKWKSLDAAAVRMLAVRRKRAGLQDACLVLRLSFLRIFFDWLVSQGVLNTNYAKGTHTPRSSRHRLKNIGVDETNQLLNIDLNNPMAVRDRTMLETIYGAGLRLSELVGLDCHHIDLAVGELWVMGKGSQERKLSLRRTAVTWLQHHWVMVRELFDPEDDAIFMFNQGRGVSRHEMCKKHFVKCGVKQGVNNHISSVQTAHLFATHIIESSGNLHVVQEPLGHTNLTNHYQNLYPTRLSTSGKVLRWPRIHVPKGGNPDAFLPSATPASRDDFRSGRYAVRQPPSHQANRAAINSLSAKLPSSTKPLTVNRPSPLASGTM